jgi:hypothetical protein
MSAGSKLRWGTAAVSPRPSRVHLAHNNNNNNRITVTS